MKIKGIKTFSFLILIIASCNNNILEHSQVETINVPENYEKQLLGDSLIENFKIVPLETNDDCLITNIDKIMVFDDKFYIHDLNRKILFVFNNKGKFLFKLDKFGRGHGEYIEFSDFTIDKNGDILIYGRLKINRYNKKGEFISTTDISHLRTKENLFAPIQFVHLNDDSYYFWTGNMGIGRDSNLDHFGLYRINNKMKLVARELPMKRYTTGFWTKFYKSLSKGYFIQPFAGNDTIYKVSENGLTRSYFIDFGKKSLPIGYLPKGFGKDMGKRYMEIYNNTDYCKRIHNITEGKNLIYFSFQSGNKFCEALYSKKSKKVKVGELLYHVKPTTAGIYTYNSVTNEFVSIMHDMAISIIMAKRKDYENEYSLTDKKLIGYIDKVKGKYYNPFIVTYKLNDF